MSIAARLMAGIPPSGMGVYARDQSAQWLASWDFVCVLAERADARAKATQLISAGVPIHLYKGPDFNRPDNWQTTLNSLVLLARELGNGTGVVMNPEAGWPQLSASERQSKLRAMGLAMRDAAKEVRCGMVSYPLFPDLGAFTSGAGGKVWISPEIYGASTLDAATMQAWYDRWVVAGGRGRVIPSIAGFNPPGTDNRFNDPGVYAQYLADVPKAGGAIAWLPAGSVSPSKVDALRAYDVGGNPGVRMALRLENLASNPLTITIGIIALVAMVGAVAAVTRYV